MICGGGATGVEAAAEFADSYPALQVRLVTAGEFGAFLNKRLADYMRRSLVRLGVMIQDQTTVAEVRANQLVTTIGETVPFDVCLWAGGFTVPTLAREAGLTVNDRGQILIDPFMRSISHPQIYAVGDASYPVEAPGVTAVRMSALTAVLRRKTPKPLSFAYLGQGIALGRHDAIGFNNYPDDKPNLPYFGGRAGFEFREFFVKLLAAMPLIEKRWPGFFYWFGKGRYAAARRRAERTSQGQAKTDRSVLNRTHAEP